MAPSDDQEENQMSILSPADIATITAKCKEDGVIGTAIADVIEHGEHGDFILQSFDGWLKEQKTTRPHWWPADGQADLEAQAFGGNFTARNRLVKQIGMAAADARAREYGLDGIHDYKTTPLARPGAAPKNKTTNPWSEGGWNISKQGQVYKSNPALAERLAKAANSQIGATRPTKVA
jgi:hypothetical protein